jgi:hypothetical protein
MNYFLLNEKDFDKRYYQSIDGYQDVTGEEYRYDSNVQNYKKIKKGDVVIIRKENLIIGHGLIAFIDTYHGSKKHKRCPNCKKTTITLRKTNKKLPYRCSKCKYEFSIPILTQSNVKKFIAFIDGFKKFRKDINFREIKDCSTTDFGPSKKGTLSQLSIIKLDKKKLSILLDAAFFNTDYTVSRDKIASKYKDLIDKAKNLDNTDGDSISNASRKEHYYAKKLLFFDKDEEKCACCKKLLPIKLLVCAHIKKRSECSEIERKDIENIVFPMCSFGCDKLYESGYIYVDRGIFKSKDIANINNEALKSELLKVHGKKCLYYNSKSSIYFDYHRRINL